LSVDIDTVPARMDSITFDNPAVPWDTASTVSGIIQGALLSNGQPAVDESKKLGITAQAVADESSSEQLRFTLRLSQAVPSGTVLHFHVTKTKDTRTVDSGSVAFTVPGSVSAKPRVQ
jgi:hypothetical protein